MSENRAYLNTIGALIRIKRIYMLEMTHNKQWNQSKFIYDAAGSKICSRPTLHAIETGKYVKSIAIYDGLLNKFKESFFTNKTSLYRFQCLTTELKEKLNSKKYDSLSMLLIKLQKIEIDNEFILKEYKDILSLILDAYINKITPEKSEIRLNLDIALVLNQSLFYLLIKTYWNLCLTEWTEHRIKVYLYNYICQLDCNDVEYFLIRVSMYYRLNQFMDTLIITKQIVTKKDEMTDNDKYLCLLLSFSALRKLDYRMLYKYYNIYVDEVNKLNLSDIEKSQFFLESALLMNSKNKYGEARTLIDKALRSEPYLSIAYFPALIKLKYIDQRSLYSLSVYYSDVISFENKLVIDFFYKISCNDDPKIILNYLLENVNLILEDTSYEFDELECLLREELLKIVAITNNYKALYNFDRISMRIKKSRYKD